MAALNFIYGPAHAEKSRPLLDACQKYLEAGNSAAFIYLTANQRRADHIRQTFLSLSARGCLAAPHIFSLERFIEQLYRLDPMRRPQLPTIAPRLLIEDVLQEVGKDLHFFQAASTTTGLVPELARFLNELKTAGVTPDRFAATLGTLTGPAQDKVHDLETIYHAYQRALDQHGVVQEDMLHALAAALTDPHLLKRRFPDVQLMCLESPNFLPPTLLSVLSALFPLIPQTLVTLDYLPDLPRPFAQTQPLYDFFTSQATHSQCHLSPAPTSLGAQLGPLLTAAPANALAEMPLFLAPCPDRMAEVSHIARQLSTLARQGKIPYNRIGVTFPSLERYIPLVTELLPQFGLAYNLPYGERLADAPIVAAILAILDTLLDQYSRETLLRLLNLPYVALAPAADTDVPALTAADLDYGTRQVRPAGGRSGWLWTLGQHIDRLEQNIERMPQHSLFTEGLENPARLAGNLQIQVDRLRHLRTNLKAFFAITAPLEGELSLDAFRGHLRHAIDSLGLLRHLEPSKALALRPKLAALAQRDARALSRFSRLLDEIVSMAPHLKQRRFSLAQITAIVRTAVSSARYQAQPFSAQGIQILPLEEITAAPLDLLFVGGLVEGEWPRRGSADIFLDDNARRSLDLPLTSHLTHADRLRFYQVMSHAHLEIRLSYPLQDEGTTLLPSSFLEPLQAVLHQAPPVQNHMPATQRDLHTQLAAGLQHPADSPQGSETLQSFAAAHQLAHLAPGIDRLVHALRISAARQATAPGAYEGILDNPHHLQTLAQRFGSHYPFSVTQLETYARCSFAFFTERLLDVAPIRDPEEDLSALERGNLIHHTLYRYYTERRNAGLTPRLLPEEQHEALHQLHEIAHQVASDMGLEGFFWERELERIVGRPEAEGLVGLLPRFVALEAADADPAEPSFFEFSFGTAPDMGMRDPQSSAEPLLLSGDDPNHVVRLFGKIDRIDVAPDGRFMVLDYKTGRIPASLKEIQRGTSLQLPIYLLAAEALLADAGLSEGVAGAYYQMRDHESVGKQGIFADAQAKGAVYHSRSRSLVPHEDFRAALHQARDHALNYVHAIRAGRFQLTRHAPEEICPHCPYRQSCRLDAQRQRALEKEGHFKS